ncbi:MAG: tetratricopeptide repeat protein [Magnetospirillum sp.]|nr:tetratricopeptide repeat protein [Magnetospirillum sp.]
MLPSRVRSLGMTVRTIMAIDLDREMTKAIALAQAGKPRQALAAMEKLVARAPDAVAARYNLALMLLQSGRIAEALPHLDRILARAPGHPPALFSKAKALLALDRAAESLPILEALAPGGDPETLLALGNAYRRLGRLDEAVAVGERLTETAPGFLPGHLNHAQMLAGRSPEAALPALERAVARHPQSAELRGMLGQCLLRLDRHEEAAVELGRAIALDPALAAPRGHRLRACRELADWEGEDRLFAALRADLPALTAPANPQLALATQDAIFFPFDGEDIRAIAEAESRFRAEGAKPLPRPRPASPPPLVVGYLSPDIREHATMHLAGDVFAAHDRSRVRVNVYSVGPDDGSDWRGRVERGCDAFADLAGLSDRAAAERIAADGVNLLIDMSVYTRFARPGIAARRPAPVQAAWLGLAATSGAPWMDYALVDAVLVPPEHRHHFTEALVFLPGCYQPNLAWIPPGPPPGRATLGLPEERVVFCSFNGHRKLDRASFLAWMDVLAAVPDSVLWQLTPPPAARRRLEDAAAAHGIDPARLVWAPNLPRAAHLERIPAADLFLDALVCGAHTTAADALRTGVPLVTVAGNRLAARVSASLLTALGLSELIAADGAAFRDLAAALGRDPARLAEVRAKLAAALPAAPLFDPRRFARGLEDAFEAMWSRHAAGRRPADIRV